MRELVSLNEPKSQISEAFRTLRTNIQFMNINKSSKSLLITSSFPGEGKSWVSANLAITFAQLGKRVVLIDADLRKGRQHDIFNVDVNPGLSDYILSSNIKLEKIIKPIINNNLFLITRGNIPPNPSELLNSKKVKNLIKILVSKYDLVIIDGTPCEPVNDARILSTIVDSTIMVAKYNNTKKSVLKRNIEQIRNIGGKIDGIVINSVKNSSSNYYYYDYGEQNNKSKIKKLNDNLKEKIKDTKSKDNDLSTTFSKELKNNNNLKTKTKNNFSDNEIKDDSFDNKIDSNKEFDSLLLYKDKNDLIKKQKEQERRLKNIKRIQKAEIIKKNKIEKEIIIEEKKKLKQIKIETRKKEIEDKKRKENEERQNKKLNKIKEKEKNKYLKIKEETYRERKKQLELQIKYEIKQKEVKNIIKERKEAENNLLNEKQKRIEKENELNNSKLKEIELKKTMYINSKNEIKEIKNTSKENLNKSLEELIKTKYSNYYATPIIRKNYSKPRSNIKVYVDIKDEKSFILDNYKFEDQYKNTTD